VTVQPATAGLWNSVWSAEGLTLGFLVAHRIAARVRSGTAVPLLSGPQTIGCGGTGYQCRSAGLCVSGLQESGLWEEGEECADFVRRGLSAVLADFEDFGVFHGVSGSFAVPPQQGWPVVACFGCLAAFHWRISRVMSRRFSSVGSSSPSWISST